MVVCQFRLRIRGHHRTVSREQGRACRTLPLACSMAHQPHLALASGHAQSTFPMNMEMSTVDAEERRRDMQSKARAALGTMQVEPYRLPSAEEDHDAVAMEEGTAGVR